MKRITVIIFVSTIFLQRTVAQTAFTTDSIRKAEMQLRQFSDSITMGSTDRIRQFSLASFNPAFLDLLKNKETFNYPFDSLPTISKLSSNDKKLKIYTWLIASKETGLYQYYGVLQRINPVSGEMKVIGLTDFKIPVEIADTSELKTDTWYGAAYYELIEKKIGKKPYYFLLGWKGIDFETTQKVIDVIYFDFWDNPTFGAPVFTDETRKKKHRLIFRYNAQAVMSLRYDKKKKMILFDHLSASSPSMKGQYKAYGPDFTYDGLQFKKGTWIYKSNLDLRNPGQRK